MKVLGIIVGGVVLVGGVVVVAGVVLTHLIIRDAEKMDELRRELDDDYASFA